MRRTMSGERIAFNLYLRTGRRVAPAAVEVKFNPWHDEENGRFTFAGQGRYFGASGGSGGPATTNPGKVRDDDMCRIAVATGRIIQIIMEFISCGRAIRCPVSPHNEGG